MQRQAPGWAQDLESYRQRYVSHIDTFDTLTEYKGRYWKKPIKSYAEVPRYAVLMPYVQGPDVLDAGCNGGAMTQALHEAGFNVTGLDITPHQIELNRQRLPHIAWECGAIEEMEYCQQFDTVVAAEVLEHVIDPVACMVKIREALKSGGTMLGTVPHPNGIHVTGAWYDDDEHLWLFTPDTLIDALAKAGFVKGHVEGVCGDQWLAFRGINE